MLTGGWQTWHGSTDLGHSHPRSIELLLEHLALGVILLLLIPHQVSLVSGLLVVAPHAAQHGRALLRRRYRARGGGVRGGRGRGLQNRVRAEIADAVLWLDFG